MTHDEHAAAMLVATRQARRWRNALVEIPATVDALGALTEGQLCEATGLDRVTVRELLDAGIVEPQPVDGNDDLTVTTVRWGRSDEALRRVFADGRERTVAEVATAIGSNVVAVTARLRRSKVVYQPRKGRWALAPREVSRG